MRRWIQALEQKQAGVSCEKMSIEIAHKHRYTWKQGRTEQQQIFWAPVVAALADFRYLFSAAYGYLASYGWSKKS